MAGVNGFDGKFSDTHGLSCHPGYRTWYGMVSRCHNENHCFFYYYGGRGIRVCNEWRLDPKSFLNWLEIVGWEKGQQVDRIDNDQGYSPENCRVVSPKENAANKRNNRIIDVRGTPMHVARAARYLGIPRGTLYARVSKGITGDRLLAPSRPKRRSES